jgi:hypothetical protein
MSHLASPAAREPRAGAMDPPLDRPARHRAAVASSVASAHECAARGDYAVALSWVAVLEAIGALPRELEAARPAWLSVLTSRSNTISEPLRAAPRVVGTPSIQEA